MSLSRSALHRRACQFRLRFVRLQQARDGSGQRGNALDALQLRAQLVVIDHVGQFADARFQLLLAILIEEEARIGQARAYHALVALNDVMRIGHLHVGHDEEFVAQLAGSGIQQREVFLVLLHGQDQAFLRHIEVFLLEFADVHLGPLDQPRHFVQQGAQSTLRSSLDMESSFSRSKLAWPTQMDAFCSARSSSRATMLSRRCAKLATTRPSRARVAS
jgi:hypothetical protein